MARAEAQSAFDGTSCVEPSSRARSMRATWAQGLRRPAATSLAVPPPMTTRSWQGGDTQSAGRSCEEDARACVHGR